MYCWLCTTVKISRAPCRSIIHVTFTYFHAREVFVCVSKCGRIWKFAEQRWNIKSKWFAELWESRVLKSSHWAYGVLCASLGQNERAHREKQRWGRLWCDERNLNSIKSFCSPDLEFHMLLCRLFWLPREFTYNHSCLHSPTSQHRPGTQGTVWEYKWAGNRAPRCGICCCEFVQITTS